MFMMDFLYPYTIPPNILQTTLHDCMGGSLGLDDSSFILLPVSSACGTQLGASLGIVLVTRTLKKTATYFKVTRKTFTIYRPHCLKLVGSTT